VALEPCKEHTELGRKIPGLLGRRSEPPGPNPPRSREPFFFVTVRVAVFVAILPAIPYSSSWVSEMASQKTSFQRLQTGKFDPHSACSVLVAVPRFHGQDGWSYMPIKSHRSGCTASNPRVDDYFLSPTPSD
jgi:hypothetical protein